MIGTPPPHVMIDKVDDQKPKLAKNTHSFSNCTVADSEF